MTQLLRGAQAPLACTKHKPALAVFTNGQHILTALCCDVGTTAYSNAGNYVSQSNNN